MYLAIKLSVIKIDAELERSIRSLHESISKSTYQLVVCRTLAELVEVPREKSFADEEAESDSETKIVAVQPEADMLSLVFTNILRYTDIMFSFVCLSVCLFKSNQKHIYKVPCVAGKSEAHCLIVCSVTQK